MSNGKRFEDFVSIEDLMKEDAKELMAKIYIQTLKTNGTVIQHERAIARNEQCIKDLDNRIDGKIGWKLLAGLSSIIMFLIVFFNVLNLIMGN